MVSNLENINMLKICGINDFNVVNDQIITASPCVVSQSIRVHLQNSRQGTVSCKSRSDLISRSNKKPWKQKGTGRARAGSPRSPLWRGGGVCFGPQKRTRVLSINKKMNIASMKYLFFDILECDKLIEINFTSDKRSTQAAYSFLKKNNLHEKKIVMFYDCADVDVYYSFCNLALVKLVSFDAIYPYVLANDSYFVYLNKNVNQFKDMVDSWLKI